LQNTDQAADPAHHTLPEPARAMLELVAARLAGKTWGGSWRAASGAPDAAEAPSSDREPV
jgi:hypothetical protein